MKFTNKLNGTLVVRLFKLVKGTLSITCSNNAKENGMKRTGGALSGAAGGVAAVGATVGGPSAVGTRPRASPITYRPRPPQLLFQAVHSPAGDDPPTLHYAHGKARSLAARTPSPLSFLPRPSYLLWA
eukprot:1145631-Pelagomonas_calceolata.AAC.12